MENPKFVDVKGVRTRYFESGEGDPLVLVHGGAFGGFDNAEDWEVNFDNLAEHFHTYAIDKVGQGFSDPPLSDEEYIIGAHVNHIYDFMSAVGIQSAHLAGHSRGGYAVTRVALEHPEVVRTLTIIDSSTLMTPPNPIYDEWARQAANIPDPREQIRYQVTANSFRGDHVSERQIDVALEILDLQKTKDVIGRMDDGLRDQFKADLVARQPETHAWIRDGGIKCPTLVIWAFNDPSATMEHCGIPCMQLILPSVPNSQMHIVNEAGHYCYREQPEAFEDVLITFIKKNSGEG